MRRFHLTSLVICMLSAALLLGINFHVQIVFANLSQGDAADQPSYTPGDRLHSNRIYVSQGWPWPMRSSKVFVNSDSIPRSMEWNSSVSRSMDRLEIDWNIAGWNAFVAIIAATIALAATEFLLRKRLALRGTN